MKLSPLETIPILDWALKLVPLSAVGKAWTIPLPPPIPRMRPPVLQTDITELLARQAILWPLELQVLGLAPMLCSGTMILTAAPVG